MISCISHCQIPKMKRDMNNPGSSSHEYSYARLHFSFSLTLLCFFSIRCWIDTLLRFVGFFPRVNEPAGLDLKSLAINFASCILFVLPLAMYLYPEYMKEEIGAVAGAMFLSLLVPPMGWKRPHPYSDMPDNRPYPRKNK